MWMMPYSHRSTFKGSPHHRVCPHRKYYTLHTFEQFGALHMHNLADKHPTRPGF